MATVGHRLHPIEYSLTSLDKVGQSELNRGKPSLNRQGPVSSGSSGRSGHIGQSGVSGVYLGTGTLPTSVRGCTPSVRTSGLVHVRYRPHVPLLDMCKVYIYDHPRTDKVGPRSANAGVHGLARINEQSINNIPHRWNRIDSRSRSIYGTAPNIVDPLKMPCTV